MTLLLATAVHSSSYLTRVHFFKEENFQEKLLGLKIPHTHLTEATEARPNPKVWAQCSLVKNHSNIAGIRGVAGGLRDLRD